MDRTEAGLQWMRRVTQWTLLSVAGLVVLIPAGDLFARDDLSPAAIARRSWRWLSSGYVQTRLLMGGMAGLHDAPRSLPLVGAAAAVALVLWGALIGGESHWMWVLPFSGVVSGAAFGAGRIGRWLVVGGGCLAAFAVGALAASVAAGTAGAFVLASFALACLLQVWIWDVTLRLDGAREQAGEVAVLRERLRFAGDLHDIQGHQLQAIALKAQLAARLIGVDDEAARGHAEDAQGSRCRRCRRRASSSRATGASGSRPSWPTPSASCRPRAWTPRSRARRSRSRSPCSRCSGRWSARARRTCSATRAPPAARSRSSATATTSSCA